MSNNKVNVKMPEHPGQPQWQTFSEWNKMKAPQSIEVVMSKEESQKEAFERFGLSDEQGGGWGDASDAQDAGWGLSNSSGGGGGW